VKQPSHRAGENPWVENLCEVGHAMGYITDEEWYGNLEDDEDGPATE
jgi:hypothetical protein